MVQGCCHFYRSTSVHTQCVWHILYSYIYIYIERERERERERGAVCSAVVPAALCVCVCWWVSGCRPRGKPDLAAQGTRGLKPPEKQVAKQNLVTRPLLPPPFPYPRAREGTGPAAAAAAAAASGGSVVGSGGYN